MTTIPLDEPGEDIEIADSPVNLDESIMPPPKTSDIYPPLNPEGETK